MMHEPDDWIGARQAALPRAPLSPICLIRAGRGHKHTCKVVVTGRPGMAGWPAQILHTCSQERGGREVHVDT